MAEFAMVNFSFLFVGIIAILALALPIACCVYVNKDAKKCGMNAALWTLITFLVPIPLGIIIYLVVKNQQGSLRCANCGEAVKEEYKVCPKCGAKLGNSCPVCGTDIKPDWNVCPTCGNNVSYLKSNAPATEKATGKSNKAALIVLAVLFILLVVSASFSLFSFLLLQRIHRQILLNHLRLLPILRFIYD